MGSRLVGSRFRNLVILGIKDRRRWCWVVWVTPFVTIVASQVILSVIVISAKMTWRAAAAERNRSAVGSTPADGSRTAAADSSSSADNISSSAD